MAIMGTYCKAYPLSRFREYPKWSERPGTLAVDALASASDPDATQGAPEYLFIQEDLVVTNGIFKDENIVFDAVTTEWETFCREVLEFEVPPYEVKELVSQPSEGASA